MRLSNHPVRSPARASWTRLRWRAPSALRIVSTRTKPKFRAAPSLRTEHHRPANKENPDAYRQGSFVLENDTRLTCKQILHLLHHYVPAHIRDRFDQRQLFRTSRDAVLRHAALL